MKYQHINEHLLLSKEQRQKHLRLDEACIEIGGRSDQFRGLLSHYLQVTIPSSNKKIHLCHACNNGKCSNVKHLYWGTAKENRKDSIDNGTFVANFKKGNIPWNKGLSGHLSIETLQKMSQSQLVKNRYA